MKKIVSVFAVIALLLSVGTTNTQAGWNYVKLFPNSTLTFNGGLNNCHTVDPDGKVWIVPYTGNYDSIQVGGVYKYVWVFRVYNPDGSLFQTYGPILDFNGTPDTLYTAATGYGMTTDHDGNIVVVKGSLTIRKIDYKTGKQLAKKDNPIPGYASSMTSPMLNSDGEVFITSVVPTANVGAVALSSDFTSVSAAIDTSMYGSFSRNVSVTSDGNDVYVHRIAKGTFHYHSDLGTLGTYTLVDTLWKELVIESSAWRPGTKELWVSSGNVVSGMPDAPYRGYAWYGFDMTDPGKPVLKDSILWHEDTGVPADSISKDPRPRGISFSPDGNTAYVAAFGPSQGFIEVFSSVTSVKRQPDLVAENYSLMQNYPNPFNPSTQIKFTLAKSTTITLRVYDVLGKEVATLAQGVQAAGVYTADFDAKGLSAGMYFYTLKTSDGFVQTKKMLLLK